MNLDSCINVDSSICQFSCLRIKQKLMLLNIEEKEIIIIKKFNTMIDVYIGKII